jgi:o-succinylbenzoate---CoA ligase
VTAPRSPAVAEGDLVAISLPPGPAWPEIVRDLWSAGAAVLPVDARLAPAAARRLVRAARPAVHVTDEGGAPRWRRTRGGAPVDAGVALVIATSGTAGKQKLVELGRSAIEAAVDASVRTLEASSADGWICCLPPAHVAGMLVLLRAVLLNAPLEVHPSFDPSRLGTRAGSFVPVVPTMLLRLVDAGIDLARFRAILVGGAHLASDLRERAERAGARIVETYGLTESCGGVVYNGLPLPGVRVRTDAKGRIELGGPTLMRGYRFDAGSTAEAFTDDGWLRTRDAGTIDRAGKLLVAGRVDDAINSGGESVWPSDVESTVARHPKVAEVLVVGRPDPEWGERVVAIVVPRDAADPPTLAEISAIATTELGRHQAPRELEVVDRLPRTLTGKMRRATGSSG